MVYLGLSVLTLGFSDHFTYCFSKHLNHTGDGLMAFGIGTVGIITPCYAIYGNGWLLISKIKGFMKAYRDHDLQNFETQLLASIRDFVDKYHNYAYNLIFD